jgi:hypothetical protein
MQSVFWRKEMETQPVKAGRLQDGRFKPGTSGNPKGRVAGSRNRMTIIAQQLIDNQGEELIQRAVEMAMSGDAAMMRVLIDRLLPAKKDTPLAAGIELPVMGSAEDAAAAMNAVLAAVTAGEITPAEGQVLTSIVGKATEVTVLINIEERLRKLENKL